MIHPQDNGGRIRRGDQQRTLNVYNSEIYGKQFVGRGRGVEPVAGGRRPKRGAGLQLLERLAARSATTLHSNERDVVAVEPGSQ